MAGYTLKLNIYTIALRKGDQKDVNFKEFHQTLCERTEKDKERLFSICTAKFLDSFQEKFVLDMNRTKGIAIKSIHSYPFQNLIDGMVMGGMTGIEQEVYTASSSQDKRDTIREDQVTALPYYFKLWMPYNSNMGVIMVQSYTEVGVVTLVVEKIKHFFRYHGFSLAAIPYVNEAYKKYFKENSRVDQLVLTQSHLSREARGALNEMFVDCSKLKVEIKVSGFNISVEDFWNHVDLTDPLNADFSKLGMDKKENFDIITIYKDPSGKRSQARASKKFDILPTIILDDDLKETGKEFGCYEKLRVHTDAILKEVKKEIGYEVQDLG